MKTYQKHFARIFCVVAIVCVGTVNGYFGGYDLTIGNPAGEDEDRYSKVAPYFLATMDAAGYSDWIHYGLSDVHTEDDDVYGYHEVLSGEWGSAIYYSGIDRPATVDPNDSPDRRQAMWLTKQFVFPDWPTDCDFRFGGTIKAEHDETNPTPLVNTARSVILNNEVEITIDYEVVDLEPLGETYSPMAFIIDPNSGMLGYVFSDRYIFLQTYTIRNIKTETLTNLEFYQFLHSHGADEYAALVNSTYTDIAITDPLSSYTPVNPVHQMGNFRYDITQWNERPFSRANHVDYVGFSSTVAPDWIDNDVFEGHGGKPNTGTHLHIEDRLLNNADSIYTAEVGGAMGWALGSLDPNETASLTVAFMFAPQQDSPALVLTKTDDLEPGETVSPGDEITYTICWENIGLETAEDVVLVDYLPAGVTYPEGWTRLDPNFVIIPADPNYDQANHTYTWLLGDIAAGAGGCVSLRVVVNERAEPGMPMRNEAVLSTSVGDAGGQWDINIECWDTGGIIFVDPRATGYNTGTSWQHAYTDLQRALARAAAACGSEIWVARGTYDPGRLPTERFAIPANVSVYGGFRGDETSRDQRDPARYKTILTGGADPELNNTVVKMGDNSILDGFRVTRGSLYGIYGKDVDFAIENCLMNDSEGYGVYAQDGNVAIKWCGIKNNGLDGIYHAGEGNLIIVENCKLIENKANGILAEDSTATIKNCVISKNASDDSGQYYGIRIATPTDAPVLYNNTIAYNANEGLSWVDDFGSGSDPNELDYPDIQNCIFYYNNDGGEQLAGYEFTHYSCVFDPNDADGSDYTLDAYGNFTGNPGFAYEFSDDPNVLLNVHLAYDSPCIDMGNPSHDANDVGSYDVDAEDRIVDSRVDIGADEVYSCDDDLSEDDIYNALDWNADGILNLKEYRYWAASWLSHDPNDPAINDPNRTAAWLPKCNLIDTGDSEYAIDLADLMEFLDNGWWLWEACWRRSRTDRFENMMASMAMGGGGESMPALGGAEGMMTAPTSAEFTVISEPAPSEEEQLARLVMGIHAILAEIDKSIAAGHENSENLYDAVNFLEEVLLDLKADYSAKEDLK